MAPPAVLGMSQVRAAFLDDLSAPKETEAAGARQASRIGFTGTLEAGAGGIVGFAHKPPRAARSHTPKCAQTVDFWLTPQ